jgi:hypothetical protein
MRPSSPTRSTTSTGLDVAVDLTGDAAVDSWRGVNAEDVDDVRGNLAGLLRSPQPAPARLARRAPPPGHGGGPPPHRREHGRPAVRPVVRGPGHRRGHPAAARGRRRLRSGPWSPWSSPSSSPPSSPRSPSTRSCWCRAASARTSSSTSATGCPATSANLSLGFHERYTSGRVISRQTSDVDAIAELLGHGLLQLTTSALTLAGITIILFVLDPLLALASLSVVPGPVAADPLVPQPLRAGLPRHPRGHRAGHRALRGVLGGIQAVQPSGGSPATRRSSTTSTAATATPTCGRPASPPPTAPASSSPAGSPSPSCCSTAAAGWSTAPSRSACSPRSCSTCAASSSRCRSSASSTTCSRPRPPPPRSCRACSRSSPRSRRPTTPSRCPRRGVPSPSTTCASPTADQVVLHDLDLGDPRRPDRGGRGRDRRGQVHHRPPRRPLLGPHRRRGPPRRRRPARPRRGRPAPGRRHGHPGELPVQRHGRRQHRLRPARRQPGPRSSRRPPPSAPTTSSAACPRATTPTSRPRAPGCRRGSASCSPSPAPSSPTRPCSSSTRPPAPSTSRERLVQRALRTLLADRTAIIIAHRLTTVEIADRVLVIDAGGGRGRHAGRAAHRGRRLRRPAPGLARIARVSDAVASHPVPAPDPPRRSAVDDLVASVRQRYRQVEPDELAAEVAAGALVVDIRPVEQRTRDGSLLGAVVIDRNVLEWRLDPTSAHRIDGVTADRRIVVVCNEG